MTCNCASCGCEISIDERKELISKIGRDLYELVYEYDTRMPVGAIADCLINVAKDLICSKKLNYTSTLGILTEMMTEGLKELLESHLEVTEEEENAADSV
jgi:hypothetical protein